MKSREKEKTQGVNRNMVDECRYDNIKEMLACIPKDCTFSSMNSTTSP